MSSSGGNSGGGVAAFAFGTAAARPAAAAGNKDTGYYATDTGEVTMSDGATWHEIEGTSASFTASIPNLSVTIGNFESDYPAVTTPTGNWGARNGIQAFGGISAWGAGVPVAQPATPVTLAQVIAVLSAAAGGCGLTA